MANDDDGDAVVMNGQSTASSSRSSELGASASEVLSPKSSIKRI